MSDDPFSGVRINNGVVEPEWIDVNGHMNVAYYLVAFDLAVDKLWESFGITHEYIRTTRQSTFAVECHITYQRELNEGDPYCVTSQMLAYDQKRIHQFQRIYHAEENYLAATAEWMNLHVNLETRRVSPWPRNVLESIGHWAEPQQGSAYPSEAGQRMTVKSPLYRLDGGEPA